MFSGALQPKKKVELQSIAVALNLDTSGTKDDIYNRIKTHLDENESDLEDDPQFSGLFDSRRRRRKQSAPPLSKRSNGDMHGSRKVVAMDPVYESTPAKDLSDVSAFLKNPANDASPSSPYKRRMTRSSLAIAGTPSSLPPLPDSPDTSTMVDRSLVDRTIIEPITVPRVSSMLQAVKRKQATAIHNTNQALFNARTFLSNSTTIWSSFVLVQLLYVYVSIVPWQYLHIPFHAASTAPSGIPPSTVVPPADSSQSWNLISVTIPYPPLATFESQMFWIIMLHWFIPTLLIPAVAGILISFKPRLPAPQVTLSESRELTRIVRADEVENEDEEEVVVRPRLVVPFDTLTASIVQLAAQIAYTFPTYKSFALTSTTTPTITSVDILGFRWRVLFASVGLAFAFAEAINGAGLLGSSQLNQASSSTALQPYGTVDTVVESEVD
ncbi:hypothetical protein D9757_003354 [Collybiopsis confluens]|uniref:SAP domain-containing protein n=1 Tax=Collybiopsis confluens TaxID=2823264 RepID=A0A8H5MFH3_9AGAR|nr:hypothetical protein D9757_003354 [Collybiopsis confluens]